MKTYSISNLSHDAINIIITRSAWRAIPLFLDRNEFHDEEDFSIIQLELLCDALSMTYIFNKLDNSIIKQLLLSAQYANPGVLALNTISSTPTIAALEIDNSLQQTLNIFENIHRALNDAIAGAVENEHPATSEIFRNLETAIKPAEAIKHDIDLVRSGMTVAQLAEHPLWPDDVDECLIMPLQDLRESRLEKAPHIWIWLDWYDAVEVGAGRRHAEVFGNLVQQPAFLSQDIEAIGRQFADAMTPA